MLASPTRFQRLVHVLRTEADSPGRRSAAVGVGIFIGCLPLYGLHLSLCLAAGWLFRLNRLTMYLAANISNPLVAPVLLFASVQAGSLLRRGHAYALSIEAVSEAGAWRFGQDLLVGSVTVGLVLGAIGALLTWIIARTPHHTDAIFEAAADRYLATGITAWEFARSKLKADRAYGWIVLNADLPRRGRLLDIGCGPGLLLAACATGRRWAREGRWPPHWPSPPRYDLAGIELRARAAAVARRALGDDAAIVQADLRDAPIAPADIVVLMDVLHMMPRDAQVPVLRKVVSALRPGGALLVREADRDAGWRFTAVRIGNSLTALVRGNWRQRFAFRSETEWRALLASLGLRVDRVPLGAGPVFGNVLLVARRETSLG